MKQKLLTFLLLIACVGNAWGIRYKVDTTAGKAVVVRSSDSYSYADNQPYSGDVVIPQEIVYNGVTYPVTSIGSSAFFGCSGLTSITIPESVANIDGNAFYNCSGLTSITIPKSVTSIRYNAFSYCSGLTSITIPESVTSIGSDAFKGCSNIESLTWGSSSCSPYDVTQYCKAKLKEVTLLDGLTSIGSDAFRHCSGLTSITIPESVTSIGVGAFSWCYGLTSITIPEGVTSIGESAFYCSGLTSITIPESVTSIGSDAFGYCSDLTSITIPESVTSIGDNAFECSGISTVYVMGVNPPGSCSLWHADIYVPSFTAYLNYYNAGWGDSNHLVCLEGPQDGEIITVNNKTAGQLASRILQKGVQLDEVVAIRITGKLNDDDWGIIKNELDLAYIDLSGANITAIPGGSFQDKKMLKTVILPESIVEIGANAFSGCKQLEGGLIFNNDVKIGANAFKNTHINSVTFNGTAAVGDYAFQSSSVKNLTFGDNANLGRSAFESVPLTEVVFNGETNIGESAFAYTKISGTLHLGDNIKSIGRYAYRNTLIEKVIVDRDYTVFDSYFSSCKNLKEVVFNGEVQTLFCAFWECSSLSTIKWPKGLTKIESLCFKGTAFEELAIPEGVEIIGSGVFDDCASLKTLDIPATVKTWNPAILSEEYYDELGHYKPRKYYSLIAGCPSLEVLSVHWNTPLAVEPTAFSKVDCTKVQLWVPYFTSTAYLNANGWKDFNRNIYERYGTVTVTAGKGGSVEIHGQKVTEQTKDVQLISGMEMVFTITPKAGYMIESVCLDGEDVTEDAEGNAYGMTYTIEEIDDNYTLEVTFVESTEQEVPVFVSAKNRYGTLIVPFDAELPAGLKAYTVDGADGTSLTLTAASTIQANAAYVIENTTAEDINTTISGIVVKGYEQGNTTGLLTGVYTKTEAPVGCYVLQNHDGVVAFYRVDGGLTTGLSVGANRCYLNMGSNSSEVKAFYLDGQATGIENLEMAADKTVIYDLSGRRVSKVQKGLYIVNGKKVMK